MRRIEEDREPRIGRYPVTKIDDMVSVPSRPPHGELSPLELFDRYAREARLAPATVRQWRSVVAKVADECRRMADITPQWCEGWKRRLLESGLSPRTVANVHLVGLRALCRWALENGMVRSNPMDGITIEASSMSGRARQRGFTGAEVRTILSATLEPAPTSLLKHHTAARRWIPWLCAYTGARVTEIARLRGRDIRLSNGIWLAFFVGEELRYRIVRRRVVPLHPHLIEQGFPDFVEKRGDGPLFLDSHRNGEDEAAQARRVAERLSRWIRQIGIDDPNVSLGNGWRRCFRQEARNADMNPEIVDQIMGYSSAVTLGEFDHYPADMLLHELSRLPRIEIG